MFGSVNDVIEQIIFEKFEVFCLIWPHAGARPAYNLMKKNLASTGTKQLNQLGTKYDKELVVRDSI